MSAVKLAVLGAGSVRCMPAIIGSLATYFGERPLKVVFWDSDPERLDLFDRFARTCFAFNRCSHSLQSTEDLGEALEEATKVVLCIDENCARKFLGGMAGLDSDELLRTATRQASHLFGAEVEVLSLMPEVSEVDGGHPFVQMLWPPEPSESERMAVPHQVLRFIHGEEYPHELFKTFEQSPLKNWLEASRL